MKQSEQEDPQFQKVFEFERTHEWRLPKSIYSAPYFQVKELQDMKRELNQVKGKLNQFDLKKWSLHTQNCDVAGYVISQLKSRIKPELLTQAWCKFFEVISTFPVVQSYDDCFTSLHLCEAPGAFICALNHYLVLKYPNILWQWYSNTLNPDYEGNLPSHMISDDRLICYTQDHWLFGIDLTGNILQYYNHADIVNQITSLKKVNLVTADGSIDCMSNPGEQEKLVEFLQYCETITALAVLNIGGTFVLKIFTIFEETTVCLLYLLNCIFDKTFLFKPSTSKSGNSELYLVCIGFNGQDVLSAVWETLIEPYKNGFFNKSFSMFSIEEIPSSFKIQLKSCCSDFFLEKQISTINDNIYYYLNPNKEKKQYLHFLKIDIANHYIRKYQLKRISKECRVVPYVDVHIRKKESYEPKEIQTISLKDWCFKEFVTITLGLRIDTVYTSKFASTESIQNFKKYNYINKSQRLFSLYNLVEDALDKTTFVVNIKSLKLDPYFMFQKELFTLICTAINSEKHIFFINVPFHTHFLAGLWSILASAFENVYIGAGWCLFYKPIAIKVLLVKKIFSVIENTYGSIDNANSVFPRDIIYIFKPNVFYYDLIFVPQILKVCNIFQIPM